MFTRNRGLNSAANWLNEGLDRKRDFESHRNIRSSSKIPALNWRVRTDTTFEDWTRWERSFFAAGWSAHSVIERPQFCAARTSTELSLIPSGTSDPCSDIFRLLVAKSSFMNTRKTEPRWWIEGWRGGGGGGGLNAHFGPKVFKFN